MIDFEKALEIILSKTQNLNSVENVPLSESIGRILAQDVISDINMPPFRKTAVDGYACRKIDLTNPLQVIGTIAAGTFPKSEILPNTCMKIMTGAPIPIGADYVIPVEDTSTNNEGKVLLTGKISRSNICELGEDIKSGNVAIKAGTQIQPKHIAIMAALGCHNPQVSVKPNIAILPTGDELVEPTQKPIGGQIRNSNGHQLIAQVREAHCTPNYFGIIKDTKQSTYDALKKALDENDVVLLTGGVSMGDFDYVPEIMKELGIQIHFDSIAVQPGKPTTFGTKGNKLIFGLPGNPVSSFIQFEFLVKPAIQKLTGSTSNSNLTLKLPLEVTYTRKRTERLAIIPAQITSNQTALPIEYHGSAHIFALNNANAVIFIPKGVSSIEKGDLVDVRQL